MEPRGTFLGTAFGLALLIALVAGAYLLLKYVGNVFAALPPQVETLAVITSVVALLCAVIIAEGLKARPNGTQAIAVAQRIATYERLLLCWSRNGQAGELLQLEQALALHGSSKVISAYLKLRRAAKHDAGAAAPLLNALVVEMRGDLGRTELIRKEDDLSELLSGTKA